MDTIDIEFELSSHQYQLMGYPALRQGEALTLELETGVLLPDLDADGWFTVQKAAVAPQLVRVAPATYAFAGQILAAELDKADGNESAVLLVDCGVVKVRVTCGPGADGRLPYGTWETRSLIGLSRLHGVIESDFMTTIGESVGMTIWAIRRLVLTPGDPVFGQWHETDAMVATPFVYDRLLIAGQLHRNVL